MYSTSFVAGKPNGEVMKPQGKENRYRTAFLPPGTIYSITFIKKNGEVRVINSIKGTRAGLRGGNLKYDPVKYGYIPVYDLQAARRTSKKNKEGEYSNSSPWRMVNLNTVSKIIKGKKTYIVK